MTASRYPTCRKCSRTKTDNIDQVADGRHRLRYQARRIRTVEYFEDHDAALEGARKALGRGAIRAVKPDRRMTLGDWLTDHYLNPAVNPRNLKPGSLRSYASVAEHHLRPNPLWTRPLVKVEDTEVAEFLAELAAALSPSGAKSARCLLKGALSTASKKGLIRSNPLADLDPIRVPKRKTPPMTSDEVRLLREHVEGDPDEALYLLLMTTGLRIGEALGLRWSDIDLDSGEVSITGKLDLIRQERDEWVKSGSGQRTADLGPRARLALRAHHVAQARRRAAFEEAGGTWGDSTDLVFLGPEGRPNVYGSFFGRFVKAIEASGVKARRAARLIREYPDGPPALSPHDLRHTWITLLLEDGAPIGDVSRSAGHASVWITHDAYGHLTKKGRANLAERMTGILE